MRWVPACVMLGLWCNGMAGVHAATSLPGHPLIIQHVAATATTQMPRKRARPPPLDTSVTSTLLTGPSGATAAASPGGGAAAATPRSTRSTRSGTSAAAGGTAATARRAAIAAAVQAPLRLPPRIVLTLGSATEAAAAAATQHAPGVAGGPDAQGALPPDVTEDTADPATLAAAAAGWANRHWKGPLEEAPLSALAYAGTVAALPADANVAQERGMLLLLEGGQDWLLPSACSTVGDAAIKQFLGAALNRLQTSKRSWLKRRAATAGDT